MFQPLAHHRWEKFKKRAEIKQRVEFLPEFSGKLIAQRVWKIKEEE